MLLKTADVEYQAAYAGMKSRTTWLDERAPIIAAKHVTFTFLAALLKSQLLQTALPLERDSLEAQKKA